MSVWTVKACLKMNDLANVDVHRMNQLSVLVGQSIRTIRICDGDCYAGALT